MYVRSIRRWKNSSTSFLVFTILTCLFLVLLLVYNIARKNGLKTSQIHSTYQTHALSESLSEILIRSQKGQRKKADKGRNTKNTDNLRSEKKNGHASAEKCAQNLTSAFFHGVSFPEFDAEEVAITTQRQCNKPKDKPTSKCIPHRTVGRRYVNTSVMPLDKLYRRELTFVQMGGWVNPLHCTPPQHTAIIIPFRNRHHHLPVLLRHLHPILHKQRLHYRIFLVEQDDGSGFNRAKLFNVGFREAKYFYPYTCFVFHDVDLIPEDDRVDYSCKRSPLHISSAVSTFNYKLFSEKLFGGVVSFRKEDFEAVNGFSNVFWVWGGEDDVMYERLQIHKLKMHRENLTVGRYTMLKHVSAARTRSDQDFKDMKKAMKVGVEMAREDGLNSMTYVVNEITRYPLYTLIKVNLLKSNDPAYSPANKPFQP